MKRPGIRLPLWLARTLAITGMLGLIFLIVLWNGWLDPQQQIPRSIELLIMLFPLLFLVRGILGGRAPTHVHATLISLLYFSIGIWFAFTPGEEPYGYLMSALSIMLYLGGFFGAKGLGTLQTGLENKQATEP
ncbi:MAG TPA: DUF2069 domain-containing protein [Thiolinea sp.]|nr:DUF2069 domain-containing protein [Thiolinea sp.]